LVVEISIKKDISELFQIIQTDLSDPSAGFIFELIHAHEWGIALETIYDLLSDGEILISRHTYNLVQKLAAMMEINTRNWTSLGIKT
jgi:hypothetical protein